MRDPDYNYERHTDMDVSTKPEVGMLQETFMDRTYARPGDGSDYVPPDPNVPDEPVEGEDVPPCGSAIKFSVGYTEVKIRCLLLPHEEKINHRAPGILTGTNGERISLVWG